MFRKLRNHLVFINVAITTIVLVIAFATIYMTAKSSMEKRPIPRGEPEFSQHESKIAEKRMRDDRQESLNSLLISLFVVGLVVEVAVFLSSCYLADIAIRPVREAYEAQKIFIANASHEIKTPLAAISANLEAADIQNNRWINNVHQEVQLLSKLNGELLQLSKIDSVNIAASERVDVKIQDILNEVLTHFESKIRAKKLKIKLRITPPSATANVPATDLRQILAVLLDNAIKYGRKNVEIFYHNHELTVSNDGAVIPAEPLSHVFDRFYQVDKAAEGSGLGLAIAKSLAERNGWKLDISSTDSTIVRLVIK